MKHAFLRGVNLLKSLFVTAILACSILVVFVNEASANLLITPTRVELGDRDRGTRMSVVNVSNTPKTYRMYWREQAQTPTGEYIRLKDNQRVKGLKAVSRMIRFSPRQISLEPGERQHIRLAVRRPANLAEGEYRSYLVFEAIPEDTNGSTPTEKGSKIEMRLNLAFSIPIVLRQGEPDVSAKFLQVMPVKRMVKGEPKFGAVLKIERKGISSSLGNVKLFWKPDAGGPERQVGVLNALAIYTEAPGRNIGIATPGIKEAAGGTLRVIYEGAGAYEGIVFDEYKQKIKASDFILEE
ncbi:MAG: hypothetical protein KAI28_04460 [Sphingomonadales bacterium]|nr:hypothetical protein [Sphingomonadales bacterium]